MGTVIEEINAFPCDCCALLCIPAHAQEDIRLPTETNHLGAARKSERTVSRKNMAARPCGIGGMFNIHFCIQQCRFGRLKGNLVITIVTRGFFALQCNLRSGDSQQ